MINLVFTIDGDWDEYFNPHLSEEERRPNLSTLLPLIDKEIELASSVIDGKFIHFVHTSPRARDFFLRPEFIKCWKKIENNNGNVGVHCHEDDPRRAYYFNDSGKMKRAISSFTKGLREAGLNPFSYRGGYLAFSPKTIPILEENKIKFDFSCNPGRHLFHGNNLVSDWRNAPTNYYQLDYQDHRREGNSKVIEIPLGFYIEKESIYSIWKKIRRLKKDSKQGMIILSVLAHTFEFASVISRFKIKFTLNLLKRYARFVNVSELEQIIGGIGV